MKNWLIGMVLFVLLVGAALVAGYIRAQHSRLQEQEATIAELGTSIGVLSAANIAQAEALIDLRASRERDDELVSSTADNIDRLATRLQSLDRQLQEALRHAPNSTLTQSLVLTLDAVLPLAATDALCLQWHEASGLGPADHPRNPALGAFAATPPSPATRGGSDTLAPDCRPWRKLTVRGAVEWNGQLLRHAGLEREDKAALRTWAEGRKRP